MVPARRVTRTQPRRRQVTSTSDGCHYENLGLAELLRRGCTNVYCFGASGGQTFAELGDAVALARSELGVEVDIDPTPLMVEGDPPAAKVAMVAEAVRG